MLNKKETHQETKNSNKRSKITRGKCCHSKKIFFEVQVSCVRIALKEESCRPGVGLGPVVCLVLNKALLDRYTIAQT